MSRLEEIIENHAQLEELLAVLKHHSVNANFVRTSLIEKLGENEQQTEAGSELVDDLKQLNPEL